MSMSDDPQNVLWLHNHGKHVCYFSEFDPFSGKWLSLSPYEMAYHAIKQLKLLTFVFHHVIFPPGYLLKNESAWILFRELKPLFELGCISISIDSKFRNCPWDFFEKKIENEVFNLPRQNGSEYDFYEKQAKKELKQIIDAGFFLFRDPVVQTRGFGDDANLLVESLDRESDSCTIAFSEGVRRLKDNGLGAALMKQV